MSKIRYTDQILITNNVLSLILYGINYLNTIMLGVIAVNSQEKNKHELV